MSRRSAGLLVVLLALATAGCNSAKQAGSDEQASASTCTRCHGGLDNATGAPPRDAHGERDTARASVGAHTAHVSGTHGIAAPLGCEACHVAPDPVDWLAHVDGEARVALGVLAGAGGVAAAYDPSAATCAAYCHGETLAGGSATRPVWTQVDGAQAACGACHGDPPPAPHPQSAECGICHPATILDGTGRTIDVAGGHHLNGVVDFSTGCADCHGDPSRARSPAAPPRGTRGETDPTAIAVGAHQVHLQGGAVAGAFACAECHAVPTGLEHLDGTAQVSFGALARRGSQPSWSRSGATCASTYCHGATLRPGGSNRTPVWTAGASQAACGTCHGAPPPFPHPRGTDCAICHPGTVRPDGSVNVTGGMHVDGTVQVDQFHPVNWMDPTAHGYAANRDLASCRTCHGADLAGGGTGISCASCHGATWQSNCTFCHGDPNRAANRAAPPVGTQGELTTDAPRIGAHLAHLEGGALRGPIACSECHTVPADLSHVTGAVELAWGDLAAAAGASPAFSEGRCASTYCHGATLGGGANTAPLWAVVDGTQATCGACHGVPPPRPHPQLANCVACHPETVDASNAILVAGGKHVNGALDRLSFHPLAWNEPAQHGYAANRNLGECRTCHGADLAGGTSGVSCSACHQDGWQSNCTFCHGDPSRSSGAAAPPVGTQGQALTTDRAVGAHQVHVVGSALARPLACAECHVTPTDLGHVDGSPAVAFGALAADHGAAPAWNGATCAATYCHGATLGAGGTNVAPSWTVVDGTQAACGACHGAPPPYPHPQNADCGYCHTGYTQTSVALDTHVNGTLDVNAMGCAGCHGDPDRPVAPAAPPRGTRGETTTDARAVGAHQAHVQGSALARPFTCDECHVTPSDMAHVDGNPGIVFGTLGGASALWNGTTCSSTYCHGATLGAGGTANEPVWTQVDGTQGACGACHDAPPPPPHVSAADCGRCHPGYAEGTVNLETHVDGKLDLDSAGLTCSSCHGDASRATNAAAPPWGTRGETLTTQRAVGAHQVHLAGSRWSNGFACTECHVVPTEMSHPDGVAQVTFGPRATQEASPATWNGTTCASTYCHGATMTGGALTAPAWIGGAAQAACGSCHGVPPTSGSAHGSASWRLNHRGVIPYCGNCHAGYEWNASVNRALHVDGTVQARACADCHTGE